jgi:hypothetical protein
MWTRFDGAPKIEKFFPEIEKNIFIYSNLSKKISPEFSPGFSFTPIKSTIPAGIVSRV